MATNEHEYSFLTEETLRERAKELASVNVTVLELAATAHWLREEERIANWKDEIIRGKGAKTKHGRLEEAVGLLASLGLEPAHL